jgi:hypothetical protein
MPAKNKRNKRNTRKVKRGGNKKALADLDVHVQYVIAHTGDLDVTLQNAMLEIAGADIDILHTYVKQADEKMATIPMLVKKLNEIKTSDNNILVITAGLALRQIDDAIKLGSGDSPVFEFRSPLHRTPKTRKKSPSSSS